VRDRRRIFSFACALAALTGGTAVAPALATRNGGHARRSPRIAFVDGLETPFGSIYSIQLDGKGLRRLATNARDPAVSPDRTRIAYSGEPNGSGGGIYVMRRDGTHVHWIVNEGNSVDTQPAWSPDRRKLVFVRSNGCPSCGTSVFQASLFTINSDGSGRRRLADEPQLVDNPGPSWIDSRHILVTARLGGAWEFAIIDSHDGRVRREILPILKFLGTQPPNAPAALSPNRRELAYAECDNGDCSSTSVVLITLRGRLIQRIRRASSPAWSPQGDLLYSCCHDPSIRGNHNQIMLAPKRGGAARAITPSSLHAGQPVWLG
jgi:WD40-like Beta Propeller Repeat